MKAYIQVCIIVVLQLTNCRNLHKMLCKKAFKKQNASHAEKETIFEYMK